MTHVRPWALGITVASDPGWEAKKEDSVLRERALHWCARLAVS